MVDNRDPRRPKQGNSKGARLEEERNNQIMHENTILLNKLSKILTREPEVVREPMLVRGLNENHKKGGEQCTPGIPIRASPQPSLVLLARTCGRVSR